VLQKRRIWAFGTLLAVLAATVLITERQPRIYRATAALIIEATPPRVLSGVKDVVELGSGSTYWAMRDYFQTQYKVIRGLEVCDRVVARLRLDEDPEFLGLRPGEEIDDATRQNRLENKVPARVLQSRITVEPVRDSMMVFVHVEDRDPARAAAMANEVVEAYRSQNIDYRRAVTQEANADLRQMVERYREAKEAADQQLLAFERQHGVGSFASRRQALEDRIKLLNERQGQLLVKRADLQARVARVRRMATQEDLFRAPLDTILSSPLVSGLKTRYAELRDERSRLAVQYGEKHPAIQAVDAQLEELQKSLRAEVDAWLRSILGDSEETAAALDQVSALLDQANRELADLAALQVEYNALAERKKDADSVYDQVRGRFTEINLAAQVETNNVRIHELATVPARPIRPDLRLNLLVGALLGLLLGLGLAFLVEQMDTTVKDREEVERRTGVPCLGIVPTIPGGRRRRSRRKDETLRERDFYVLQHPKSAVSEALNTIRTNLMFLRPDSRPKTLLITSGSPWEGKSTVALALGITMARNGLRTLLVDGDIRRPRLHRAFGVAGERGFASVLAGQDRWQDAVQDTGVPGLDLLPCGPVPENPSELLRVEVLRPLFEEWAREYDAVLLDSPPVIPISDPRILASQVDGVVLVVKLEHTTSDALSQVRRELAAVGAPLLGTVLNDLDIRRQGYYGYRYGYAYRYKAYEGYGYHEERTPPPPGFREPT